MEYMLFMWKLCTHLKISAFLQCAHCTLVLHLGIKKWLWAIALSCSTNNVQFLPLESLQGCLIIWPWPCHTLHPTEQKNLVYLAQSVKFCLPQRYCCEIGLQFEWPEVITASLIPQQYHRMCTGNKLGTKWHNALKKILLYVHQICLCYSQLCLYQQDDHYHVSSEKNEILMIKKTCPLNTLQLQHEFTIMAK